MSEQQADTVANSQEPVHPLFWIAALTGLMIIALSFIV